VYLAEKLQTPICYRSRGEHANHYPTDAVHDYLFPKLNQ